ncbi:MAG: M64 family metallopeptidase [Eubacteriales bacterium]|nr:M64 family metallopeptidase [Eubacteriales bacterium]
MKKRIMAVVIAFVISLTYAPLGQSVVYAEELTAEEPAEELTAEEVLAEEPTVKAESSEDGQADETPSGEYLAEANDALAADAGEESSLRLLYGDEKLADEDALVLLVMGDGFTVDEQDSFWDYAQSSSSYLMTVSPWDEFAGNVKIYGIATVSNESGVKGDSAPNYSAAQEDTRDTYFGAYYWSGGTQRALGLTNTEAISALKDKYNIVSDSDIILVNSKTEGGTTWTSQKRVLLSVDAEVNDCIAHELGHCVAVLADEYWASGYEAPNMTSESDPEKVKWSRFVGLNGVGVYSYGGAGAKWYRPSQGCKMQLLKNDFCEVCKEALRDSISKYSNITNIAFQTYADQFYEGEGPYDMSEYFILRKGNNKVTGDKVGNDLHLTYMDSEGNVVDGIPEKAGNYTVKADFSGNDQFDACTLTGSYTIQLPNIITIDVASKDYDGEPIEMSYIVEGMDEDDYDAVVTYTGTFPYSKDKTKTYESTEAPRLQGNYTVIVEIYDKETGRIISQKSKEFEIGFSTVPIVVNSDPAWPGASSADSNFTYYIYGDGYTVDEQDKFLSDAREFVKNFLMQEPYRDMSSYFNFYAVPTVSETSGISNPNGDTYFGLHCDENGKIIADPAACTIPRDISYDKLDPYYRTAIVIVNDKNATESSVDSTGKHGTVLATPDKDGAAYAAREATNIFVGNDPGHEAASEEELEEQKIFFLEYLAYSSYTMILTDTYRADFVENGEPVDITDYLHTYNTKIEIPNEMLEYAFTYYADDNGEVGEQLEGAPAEPGTYHVFVTLVPNSGSNRIVNDGFGSLGINSRRGLYITKAWTTFTIRHAEAVKVEAKQPTYEKNGNLAYWYCSYCGKYYADNDGVMDESAAYDDNTIFLIPALVGEDSPNSGTDTGVSTDSKTGSTANAGSVKTGDTSNADLWFLLLAGCGMIAVFTAYKKKSSVR